MKLKEIEAKIAEIKSHKDKLVDRSQKSQSVEHVRAIKKELEVLNDEIEELEEMRNKIISDNSPETPVVDSSEVPEDAKLVNGDVVRGLYGGGASFSINGGGVSHVPETASTMSLRSNETLFSRLPQSEKKTLDLGKCVRGMVTGNWSNATEERSAINTTSAGVLIPAALSAHVIDKARNLSLFTSAGVPIVPMTTNNLTVARVANDPEFSFKEELAEADESNFSLDSVELKAKTAYGYAYVSLEAIHSASNLNEILYQVFSQAFADMCDKGMLYGQSDGQGGYDSFAPSGVMNDSYINTVEATNRGYTDFIKAIGKIRRANGNPTVVGMNAATEEYLSLLTDSNSQLLEVPKAFSDLTKVVSNQLNEDESTGSDALVFDPQAMMIGVQNNIVIRMFTDSDYCIKHGAVGFQIYAMMDCAVVQPKHITKITGVKEVANSNNNNDGE